MADFRIDNELAKKIREANIKLHDAIASTYDKEKPVMKNRFAQKIFWQDIDVIKRWLEGKSKHALDIGCGTGNIALKLLKKGFVVTGVDSSARMLEVLKNKAIAEGTIDWLKIELADVDEYLTQAEDKYDLITFCSVLHHLPDYLSTLESCPRPLRPGGIIYIVHEPSLFKKVKKYSKVLESLDGFLYLGVTSLREEGFKVFMRKSALFVLRRLNLARLPQPTREEKARAAFERLAEHGALEHGLDEEKVKKVLEKHGFKFIVFEKYDLKRFWLTNFLVRLLRSKRLLKVIAQKD